MRMIIVGGGFLGQLLHTLWPRARVFDWRPAAPKTPARQLGPQYLWQPISTLPCRKFEVHTTVDGVEATDASVFAYKKKVEKEQDAADWRAQFRPLMDGYECTLPADRVEYGKRITSIDTSRKSIIMDDGSRVAYDVIINTIPLDSMLQLVGIQSDLRSKSIYLYTSPCSVCGPHHTPGDMYVNYLSLEQTPVYRQTHRDGLIHTESLSPFDPSIRAVKFHPGKIYEHPDTARWVNQLEDQLIFCLGRFARWSPDELAHETWQDALRVAEDLT